MSLVVGVNGGVDGYCRGFGEFSGGTGVKSDE